MNRSHRARSRSRSRAKDSILPSANEEYLQVENSHLRHKNYEFAKAISELKISYQQSEQDRKYLQKEYMSLLFESRNHGQNNVKIQQMAKALLDNLCTMGSSLAEIVYISGGKGGSTEPVANNVTVIQQVVNNVSADVSKVVEGDKSLVSTVTRRRKSLKSALEATSRSPVLTEEDELPESNGDEDDNNGNEEDEVELEEEDLPDEPEVSPPVRLETLLEESEPNQANSTEFVSKLDAPSSPAPSMSGILQDSNRLCLPSRSMYSRKSPKFVNSITNSSTMIQQENDPTITRKSADRADPSGLQSPITEASSSFNDASFRSINTNSPDSPLIPRVVHKRKIFPIRPSSPTETASVLNNQNESTIVDNMSQLCTTTAANDTLKPKPFLKKRFEHKGNESLQISHMGLLQFSPTGVPTSTPYTTETNARKRQKPTLVDTTPNSKKKRPKRAPPNPMAACTVVLKRISIPKRRSSGSSSNTSLNSSVEKPERVAPDVTETPVQKTPIKTKAKSKSGVNRTTASTSRQMSTSPSGIITRSVRKSRPNSLKEPSLLKKLRR